MKKSVARTLRERFTQLVVCASIFAYTLFSIGVIKATHFCMGREASVALFTTEAEKCACSAYAGEKGPCCDDDTELVRIDDDQKVISSLVFSGPSLFVIEALAQDDERTPKASGARGYSPEKGPPLPRDPLWKIHCSLVFYDKVSVA